MSPLSLENVTNIAPTLNDLLLPVVADGYKYPTPSPTDSAGRGGSYSPTEEAHMTHISADLLMSPDSQPSLSPDLIGYGSHHGNSNYDNSSLDNLLTTSGGNTTNLTSFDLSSVSVSDILSEVQASLDTDTTNITTSQCNPLTSANNTTPVLQSADSTLLSFGDLTNSSNLLGFTMISSSLGATSRVQHDPSGARQRYSGVAPSNKAGAKRRSAEKEAAIRSIVDSFHQVEQMVPANEMMPNYTM